MSNPRHTHHHPDALVSDLHRQAQQLRLDVLEMVNDGHTGHIGGAFSCAEILSALYFHHLRVDPQRPDWPERDRLLFSKGHACAALYAALAHRGFFPVDELLSFRKLDSRLQGHPDPKITPGIEIAAGPLGHGVAIGCGVALGFKLDGDKPSAQTAPSVATSPARVYVVLGDGELDAGVIWEGVMLAAKYRLGNLTAILDYNGIQQTGATADVMPTEPIADKWQAFGWHVQEVGGHSVRELLDALDRADQVHARPSIIIARTTKGRGVSFMEYDHNFHGTPPTAAEYAAARRELEQGMQAWAS